MKAIVYEKYGSPDVLELKDVEKPVARDNEVLIKVHAVSLNFSDNAMLKGEPFMVRFFSGLQKPKNTILGADIAGIVEAVGKNVTQFKPGDEVIADKGDNDRGGLAEYVCADEGLVVLKPANITFEEASTIPIAAVTALQGIKYTGLIPSESDQALMLSDNPVKKVKKALVNGASGGVGTFVLQIVKTIASEVTAVCNTDKIEMVRSRGADKVIDYKKEDFTKNGEQYDLIIACNGYHPISDYKRSLSPDGIYVCIGGKGAQIFQSMFWGPIISLNGKKKLGNMGVAKANKDDLIFINKLINAGKIKPVIDKCYPLSEAKEAFRHYERGHVKGKIVVTVCK